MSAGSWWRKTCGTPRLWLWATAVAVLVRVAIFLYTIVHPLTNEMGAPVSPTTIQRGIDFDFYMSSKVYYSHLISSLERSYHSAFDAGEANRFYISGPVFPLLLVLFDYGEGHTLPLSVFFLVLSCALAIAWLAWLNRQGLEAAWLFLFALIPNPLWYTINISTDLLFSALFAGFFLPISRCIHREGRGGPRCCYSP